VVSEHAPLERDDDGLTRVQFSRREQAERAPGGVGPTKGKGRPWVGRLLSNIGVHNASNSRHINKQCIGLGSVKV